MSFTGNDRHFEKKEMSTESSDETYPDNEGSNECAVCQDTLKKPIITLPCQHRFCSSCLESWRGRYVFDKQKTCPLCRSKIPATKSMICQLESFRRLRADVKNKLNKYPCPLPALPGTEDYNYTKSFYGNISDEEIFSILDLPHELQQNALRSRLETAHLYFDCQIRDLEEQIGDGTGVLEDFTDEHLCDELPADIGRACENNDVERVLKWLGDQPVTPKRINARNSKSNEMTLLHHATRGNRLHLVRLLLQHGADLDSATAMGLTPFIAACTSKRYHSIALTFLEWGAAKDKTAPGPPGVEDISAIDIAQNYADNEQLANILKSPLGGRRCEIFGLQSREALNGQSCIVGKYFEDNDSYAVRIGEDPNDGDNFIEIKSCHLNRCDRTVKDPGVLVEFLSRDPMTNRVKWGTTVS